MLDVQIALLEYLEFKKLRTPTPAEIEEHLRKNPHLEPPDLKAIPTPPPGRSTFTRQTDLFESSSLHAVNAWLQDGSFWLRKAELSKAEQQQLLGAGLIDATSEISEMFPKSSH